MVALLMMAAAFFDGRASAQTAIERLKSEYPAVMEQYGKKLQDLKTHYIFVIDVSGTMDEYKDKVVVPGVKNFVETLPEGDYASIVAFGGRAALMCTPLKLNSENRKILVEKMYESYDASAKLDGGRTYLKEAAAMVLKVVKDDDFSDVCVAVFFSDLCDESSGDWNYKDKVAELKGRPFGVVATALTTKLTPLAETQKNRGIQRMENTFPGFAYSSNIKDVFGEKLEAFKYNIYVPELKRTVKEELTKTLEETQLSSEIGIGKKVKLCANINKEVPAFIKGIVVDTAWLTDQSPEIAQVEFISKPRMPRYSKSVKMGKVVFAQNKLFHNDQYITYALKYHLETPEPKTAKDSSFVSDLEQLEIADALYSEAALEAKGAFVFGWPLWLIIVLCIFILAFLVLLIKNTIIPGRIRSKRLLCQEGLNNRRYTFNLNGKRKIHIGKPDGCKNNNGCPIPGTSFLILVKAKNGGPLNWIIKKKIVVSLEGDDAQMRQEEKGKTYPVKKADLLKGKVTVQSQGVNYDFSLLKN